jgi:MYND finger
MDPPTKKDKVASATEARVCGNCLAPEDQFGETLIVCPRCKLTLYCSNHCQTADWMAGHKQHCLTPEQRRVPQQAKAPGPGTRASSARAEQGPIELPVRLDMAFVQEAFAAGLDAACPSDDEEDVEPSRTRKQPKLHNSSSSYDGGSSGEDGTSIAEEDSTEVSVLAVNAALTNAGIDPRDVSVLRIGPSGDLPTKPIAPDPDGDALARLGRTLDVEKLEAHPALAALGRILSCKTSARNLLLVDFDLK